MTGPASPVHAAFIGAALALAAASLAACGAGRDPTSVVDHPAAAEPTPDGWRSLAMRPERPAPEIDLVDQTGARWTLSGARGRVVLVFFGYTHCPDVCPRTLAVLAAAAELVDAAGAVTIALVTVDPARDTPAVLADYVASFGPGVVGLSGAPADIAAVADAFGARYEVEAASGATAGGAVGDYGMAHTDAVFVVDAYGQLRRRFVGLFTPEDVAHDLRRLLRETSATSLANPPPAATR